LSAMRCGWWMLVVACWTPGGLSAGPEFEMQIMARDAPERAAQAGETAILALELRDGATGYPLSGLHPGVWIRPARAGRSACRTAIGTYLATGANATRDLDLNGYRFVLLGADGALSVIDPRLDLASSNLLWLRRLGTQPVDWTFDHGGARVFVALPEAVSALDLLTGAELWRVTVRDGRRLVRDPATGRIWAVTRDALLVLEPARGAVLQRIPLPEVPRDVAVEGPDRRMWVLGAGHVVEVDLARMSVVEDWTLSDAAQAVVYSPAADGIALALKDEPRLALRFLDAPDRRPSVDLAAPADRLAVSADGRWLFALHRASGTLSIVDWARLRLRHVLVFPGRPDQMAVSEDYLYLRETQAPRVSLVHISSLDTVPEPGVLDVALGSRAPGARGSAGGPSAVVPLPEGGGALIAATADRTVFLYLETGMQAPSNAFRVWTEGPLAVAIHDRTLTETRPGHYEAPLRLPHGGRYELLLHLAQPPLAECREFTVAGEGMPVEQVHALPRVELHMEGEVQAGRPASVALRVADGAGRVLEDLHDLELLLMDVSTHAYWRGRGAYEGGVYRFRPLLPYPGRYRAFARSVQGGFGYEDVHLPAVQVFGDRS